MPSNAIAVCCRTGSCPLPASVLAWRRCHAGSCPLPVSVRPCLPSSLPPALVPCLSVSLLSLLLHKLSSLARQRPPLPAVVVVAAAATNGRGRARQIVAVRRRPCRPAAALAVPLTSIVQCRHNHCCHQALFAAATAAKSRAFWVKYLFTYRGIISRGS